MVWTDPDDPSGDAVTGVVAPAAMWDTFVKDNMAATMHVIARKSADQTSTITTFANDNHLVAPVKANEVWYLEAHLMADIPNAADMKAQWTTPAGTTGNWSVVAYGAAVGQFWVAGTGTADIASAALLSIATQQVFPGQGGARQGIVLKAIVAISSTAGNVQLQWAENAASGTLTVFTNSFLAGMRLSP